MKFENNFVILKANISEFFIVYEINLYNNFFENLIFSSSKFFFIII